MIAEKRVANAVGGKTARACDSCIKKRARWYCAADDAFLCQGCDASVHSANPLANRHERVRLKTSSFKSLKPSCLDSLIKNNQVPSWQRGVTRKARTPRPGNMQSNSFKPDDARRNRFSLVPEFGVEELVFYENEEQLLYRVPVFDPLRGELSTSTNSNDGGEISNNNSISTTLVVLKDDGQSGEAGDCNGGESKDVMLSAYDQKEVDDLKGFLSSEMDLADFAADVESLLGKSLDNGTFGIEELGLMECKEKDSNTDSCCLGNNGWVKLEDADTGDVDNKDTVACHFDMEFDMTREQFELSFDYESPATCEDEEENVLLLATVGDGVLGAQQNDGEAIEEDGARKKRRKLLSINYEAVISAWASQGSPWTAGIRPNFDPEDCWPNCMGTCGIESHNPYAEMGGLVGGHSTVISDGGREARVSRYREKRRTRLFSKKIRYEVRKLNAEKRPRMKGRFVKRASLAAGASFPPAVLSK